MKSLVLWRLAEEDIEGAYSWYEGQRPGLGDEFLDAVRSASLRARSNPLAYAKIKAELRHVRLDRFPYNLIFKIEENAIHVIACMHAHRDHSEWAQRT